MKTELLPQSEISTLYSLALVNFLRNQGYAGVDQFLAKMNIEEVSLKKRHAMMPMGAFLALIEQASIDFDDPYLGLHYYEDFDLRDMGVFGYALMNSKSLRDALSVVSRYYCMHQSDSEISLWLVEDKVHISYRITAKNLQYSRQDSEMTLMANVMVVRRLVDDAWRPEEVHFQHPAPADISEHQRLLCSNIFFNQSVNKMVFEKSLLGATVANADTRLSESLNSAMDQLLELAQVPADNEWLRDIQDQVIESLHEGTPGINTVAERMSMSNRTLQRRLSGEGLCFKDLVESIRHQLAIKYLSMSDLSLVDAAFMLGYSELSSFNRAFRRWEDCSPLEYRKSVQG